eukprot:3499696-Pyramimonas_sp.AAC.1
MEGGSLPKGGSRFSAAHIRREKMHELRGWLAVPVQHVCLASAPRKLVSKYDKGFTDAPG